MTYTTYFIQTQIYLKVLLTLTIQARNLFILEELLEGAIRKENR